MYCVSFAFFYLFILVNGEPKGPIYPNRGLRQGDHLSPCLFLLCTEGLVCLLKRAALDKSLEGIRVCMGAPQVNHLLFVDDNLIFCKAKRCSSTWLLEILNVYAIALEQCINTEKTTMVISRNVKNETQDKIKSIWGCTTWQQYEKYLSFPPIVGISKKKAFVEIKSKVGKCLQSWKGRLLSQGVKEVLIKAVVLAISMFAISCFKLLITLCSELKSLMTNFWWGQKENEKKIH